MLKEKTILIIKPDAVKKKVVGKIISILEDNNLEIIEIFKTCLNKKDAENFYFEHREKKFYDDLISFIISGHIVVILLEGISVIKNVRNLVGHTNFKLASSGTIRQQFGTSLTENAVHASDSNDSFLKEYKILFTIKN